MPSDTEADTASQALSRRSFLGTAAVGLVVAFQLPLGRRALAEVQAAETGSAFAPNAFLRITPDDWVTVVVKHHEMGQGTTTGIATLIAEELDADLARVRAEYAPSNEKLYNNLAFGSKQGTGGSSAMKAGWEQMRKAGASARAVLVQAAADAWHVPAREVRVERGVLSHASGKRGTFGQFAIAASKLSVPDEPKLKDPRDFKLIGKNETRRLDSRDKCTGKAIYTIDVKLPGLLSAVIARPPAFGAKLRGYDARAAKNVRGVKHVVQVEEGIAVVATGMWAALQGRDALSVDWDLSDAQTLDSEKIFSDYRALAKGGGGTAVQETTRHGFAMRSAKRKLEAVYEFPYLAHAPMEPTNCVAWLHDGRLETWSGHQFQSFDHENAAQAADLPHDHVSLHTLISGGSFGRRANRWSDFVVEAVHVAKATGESVPVRVQRTREDDMRAGLYRPMFVHDVQVGLDDKNLPCAWRHTIVGQSIQESFPGAFLLRFDKSSVEGVSPSSYTLPEPSITLHSPKQPVRVLWWRSVGHTHTAFVMETMMDELAEAAHQDPVAFRLTLLREKPRHAAVLKLAAERAEWQRPLPAGRARGVAIHESFDTVVAQVVEVSLHENGLPRVERVVVAVDCGTVVNPDIVRAQMEGGVGFALSAALYSEIRIEKGAAKESNFHDYRALRMADMPRVEVHCVASQEAPTGVGEPGVPPLAPAVANALYKLTGQRIRRLPFRRSVQRGKSS